MSNGDISSLLKRLEDIALQVNRSAIDFRRVLEELREACSRQNEKSQREKEAAVLAARVEAQVAALQPDNNADSTLQPALDNDNQKKVTQRALVAIFEGFNDCFWISVCKL